MQVTVDVPDELAAALRLNDRDPAGAALEAMALEKPIICSRVGGTQDVIIDGETGLFIPPRQPPAIVDAVEALQRDPERARRLGVAGRRRVEECFRAEDSNQALLELYSRLW